MECDKHIHQARPRKCRGFDLISERLPHRQPWCSRQLAHNQEPQRGIGPRAVLSLSVIESGCGLRGPGHLLVRRAAETRSQLAIAERGVCRP